MMDFSMLDDTQQNISIDDYFLTKKKKTLKDYDEEIKQLQNENINLKLRIYLLEEKNKDYPQNTNNDYNPMFFSLTNNQYDELNQKNLELQTTIDFLNEELKEKQNIIEFYVNKEKTAKNDDNQANNHQNNGNSTPTAKSKIPTLASASLAGASAAAMNSKENNQNKLRNDLLQAQNEIKKCNEQINRLKEELIHLQDIIGDKDELIKNLIEQKNQALATYKQASDEHIENLIKQSMIKDKEIYELRVEIENYKSEKLTNEIENTLNDKQQQQLLLLQQQQQESINEIKKYYEKEIKQLETVVSDLKNQIELTKKTSKNKLLTVEANYKNAGDEDITLFIQNFNNQILEKDKFIENCLEKNKEILKEKEDQIIALNSKLNDLNNELNKINDNSAQFDSTNYNKLIQNFKKDIDNLVEENTNLKEKLDSVEQVIMADYTDNQLAKENLLSDLRNKFKATGSLRKTNEHVLFDDKVELFDDVTKLRSELNRKTIEYKQILSELEDNKRLVASLNLKISDKDKVIADLIESVKEKDLAITKLNKNLLNEEKQRDINDKKENGEYKSLEEAENEIANLKNKDESKQRKIDGLLKLIQQKNNEIETLKADICNLKLDKNSPTKSFVSNKPLTQGVKLLIDSLEKEIEIYKKLNDNKNTNANLKENLTEVVKLRNQLLKASIFKDNHNLNSSLNHSFDEKENDTEVVQTTSKLFTVVNDDNAFKNNINSKTSNDDYFKDMDSVLEASNKKFSENLMSLSNNDNPFGDNSNNNFNDSMNSTNNNNNRRGSLPLDENEALNKMKKGHYPSISSGLASTTPLINPLADLMYKKHSRNDLINLLEEIENENKTLKRQIDKRSPKITELHNELENLRNKLAKAERLNEYFKKQIEIHHITHGNIDLLMEMAQELNFTKEELEAYKDKLARTKDIRDSLIKAANSKSLSAINNSDSLNNSLNSSITTTKPTQQIKITVSSLEKQIEELKDKYHRLQLLFLHSEKHSHNLFKKLKRYEPSIDNEIGFEKSNIKRWSSDSELNVVTDNNDKNNRVEVDEEIKFFQSINDDKLNKLKEENKKYFKIALNLYKALKKTHPDVIKELFDPGLINLFENHLKDEIHLDVLNAEKSQFDLLQSLFADSLKKYEEVNRKLKEKERDVDEANKDIEGLKENVMNKDREIEHLNKEINQLKKAQAEIEENKNSLISLASSQNDDAFNMMRFARNLPEENSLDDISIKGYCMYAIGHENEYNELRKRINELKKNFEGSISTIKEPNSKQVLDKYYKEVSDCDILIRSFWLAQLPQKNELGIHLFNQNSNKSPENTRALKAKVKKYKAQIDKLKEKIRSQNVDIEEALNKLLKTNRDKENTQEFITQALIDAKKHSQEVNQDFLANQLNETHSRLKKARDNIQSKLDEAGIELNEINNSLTNGTPKTNQQQKVLNSYNKTTFK